MMQVAITTTGGMPQLYIEIDTSSPFDAAATAYAIAKSGDPFEVVGYNFAGCLMGGKSIVMIDPDKVDGVRVSEGDGR